jgi:molybdopterin-guanine dinucleotide biosynthesis protein A|tara:strand:+ start:176 stop:799 length:624 start_codon:yes stop_codon:yes gene_type:complete
MNDNNILAVVLAGGQSKRFGEDKNQVKLGNITLLEHVLAKVTNKFEKILIISNQNLNIKTLTSITIIPDCIQGNLGPLVGVLTAMKWIKKKNKQYQWIATFPCDTPFFDTSIIEKYKSKINLNESLLYFVKSNQKRHNIFGLWSVKLIDTLENDLVNNNFRKVEEWADKIGVKIININSDKFDYFFNINTKTDLEEARKLLEEYKND